MRKLALICIVLFALSGVGWMIIQSVYKLAEKEDRLTTISTVPSLKLVDIDNTSFHLSSGDTPLVLILFNSECEHCRYEAKAIKKSIQLFKGTRIVLVSEQSLDEIERFGDEHELKSIPNITLAKASMTELIDTFVSISYPSIFIYGKSGELIKEFKGEVKIDAIITLLNLD
ncbi:MAG: redoxin domain-containing protein [Cyclobacteriaceae bacterium]